MQCPIFSQNCTPIKTYEWLLAARSGKKKSGEQRTQLELTETLLPLKAVVKRLSKQLVKARKHHNETKWSANVQRIDEENIPAGEIWIGTDFSATMNLKASFTDNCSEDAHAVLDIFVVLSEQRPVTIEVGKTGRKRTNWIYAVDVWYFFGDSLSKGKKNDHVFHNTCIDFLTEKYKARMRMKGIELVGITIWTDNCSGQYKCRQNFWKIATFYSRNEVLVKHRFAQKYHFKGVWDAAGKVIKQMIVKGEYSKERSATAYDCFDNVRLKVNKLKYNWRELEAAKHPDILKKGKFMCDSRFVGYVAEDWNEYQMWKTQLATPNVLHSPRLKPAEACDAIKDTLKIFSVRGTDQQRAGPNGTVEHLLIVAANPCACLSCRGESTAVCKFEHVRQEREEWVSLEAEKQPGK